MPPSSAPVRALAALALGAAAGCAGGEPEAAPLPSILVITTDTVRADALGCYGSEAQVTPHMDRLAAEGVRFDQARTTCPITLPAHASMFTGLYPPRHGVRDNSLQALAAEARTTAEEAREAGYETAAFLAAVVLDRTYGLDQGFDTYDEPRRALQIQRSKVGYFQERPARDIVPEVEAWLAARDRERPFFLWVHFYDAHQPLEPTPELLARAKGDAYLAEVAAVDDAVGALVERLRSEGALDSTWVALLSDHGEALGEHGESSHGLLLFDSTVRVPFLVRRPGAPAAGSVVREPVSVADLHPTLLAAMGRPLPEGQAALDGVDLFDPDAKRAAEGVYFESYFGFYNCGWRPIAGWSEGERKYVHAKAPSLFAPLEDPGELRNLWTPSEASVAEHVARIAQVFERPALAADLESVDPAHLAEIQKLGYAGVGFVELEAPSPLEPSERPDPHDRLPDLDFIDQALALDRAGRVDEAAILLDSIVERDPHNFYAMQSLASILNLAERWEDARYWYKQLDVNGPPRADTKANMAFANEKLGDHAAARRYYREALDLQPTNMTALRGLARLLQSDPEHAEEVAALRARAQALRGQTPAPLEN